MNKTIGEAKYLQKGNGDYIPFRVAISDINCDTINSMLDKTAQEILYISKDNK